MANCLENGPLDPANRLNDTNQAIQNAIRCAIAEGEGGGGLPTGLAPIWEDDSLQVLTSDPDNNATLDIKPTDGVAGIATLELDTYGVGGNGSQIYIGGAGGVAGAPTALAVGDTLGSVVYWGHDGTTWRDGAFGIVNAVENWGSTHHAVELWFYTIGTIDEGGELNLVKRFGAAGTGAFTVGEPTGPNATPGDVNIAGTYKVNGAAIGAIQTAQVSLSSAQLLALNATPIQIVAAPGAGKVLSLVSAMYDYTFVTTAYSGSNPATLALGPSADDQLDAGIAPASTSVSFIGLTAASASTGDVTANVDNAGMYLTVASALTLGNGTLKVTANYLVLTR